MANLGDQEDVLLEKKEEIYSDEDEHHSPSIQIL